MKSPRTTLFGLVAGAGGAVAALQGVPPWLHTLGLVVAAVATACLGMVAKDEPPTDGNSLRK